MAPDTSQSERRDNVFSTLNVTIETLNLAKEIASITPAKAVFGSVSVLLAMIRDSMINQADCVDLGLACASVCTALDRGLNGKQLKDLNDSVFEAISQLTTAVAEIQKKLIKWGKRNAASRMFHAKNDKETITTWKSDLAKILLVFNTELGINILGAVSDVRDTVVTTHTIVAGIQRNASSAQVVAADVQRNVASTHVIVSNIHDGVTDTHDIVSKLQHDVTNTYAAVSDIRDTVIKGQGGNGQNLPIQTSIPGESPPPPPRACFGRGELVEEIVSLAELLTPIALIGTGGIGKTSIALSVLHHTRIKQQFGSNRRLLRCDQFSASLSRFLSRLSKIIGADAENPEDLTPLRPFLSSKEMFIVLDNAESILDPKGMDAEDIYAVVEELSQFSNICLCITSRISTIPPDCKTFDIPTLSIEAAHDTFYHIYKNGEQPDLVDNILEQLEFHPLSISLLATVAHHNKWDTGRLAGEWEKQRTGLLHTLHNKSLAMTIEVSLASPMFKELGPDAQGFLGVVAFFPQGINENNLDWLFPTIPTRRDILDKFCILSLTYRSNGSITMLAPLRDHLSPKDPKSSPLLCMAKECYFGRLSAEYGPQDPGFKEAQWIRLEDANVEHMLDVFTSFDADSDDVWHACTGFMRHLHEHKPRLTMLGSKIRGLPDTHPFKPECLFWLSRLFESVGHNAECKQLLVHTLELWRGRRNGRQVARTLLYLSITNRLLFLPQEAIKQAVESLKIYRWLGDTSGETHLLGLLAGLFLDTNQLDFAEEAASKAINLGLQKGDPYLACLCHRTLGDVYHSKGKAEMAIDHLEKALEIASSFNWQAHLFGIHLSLANVFSSQDKFDDAYTHIKYAKLYVANDMYHLGRAMLMQAQLLHRQHKHKDTYTEALQAVSVFEKIGAIEEIKVCRQLMKPWLLIQEFGLFRLSEDGTNGQIVDPS